MSSNANWARWIFASVATALKAVQSTYPVMIEGLDDRTDSFMQATNRVEIRISGPSFQEPSHNYFVGIVEVSILVSARYDSPTKNAYSLHTLVGKFQTALNDHIHVWNYGSEAGDYVTGNPGTQVHLGCLIPIDDAAVIHFGQIDQVDRIKQAAVETRYQIELTN